VLTDVEATSKIYEFWRIDWIPNTKNILGKPVGLLWAAQGIPKDQADPNGDYPVDPSENVLEFIFSNLGKQSGPTLSAGMQAVYGLLALFYGTTVFTGPLRNMLPVDRQVPIRVAMAEWSFNPADLSNVREKCNQFFQKNGWPNLPIEIELTKTDNFFMSCNNTFSTQNKSNYVVKFNFMYATACCSTPPLMQKLIEHLQNLWNFLVNAGIVFKAHWGKMNFMDAAFVQKHYDLEPFKPAVSPLFMNQYLRERLGPLQ